MIPENIPTYPWKVNEIPRGRGCKIRKVVSQKPSMAGWGGGGSMNIFNNNVICHNLHVAVQLLIAKHFLRGLQCCSPANTDVFLAFVSRRRKITFTKNEPTNDFHDVILFGPITIWFRKVQN